MSKIANKLYSISATATGGRDGHVKSEDGILDVDLKTPGAMGGQGGATNPEELFAAGYAACFNGALNLAARLKRITPSKPVEVKATVTLGKDEQGNFQLAARIDANVPGVSQDVARELVEQAHGICPYSRATKGNIEVELNATNN